MNKATLLARTLILFASCHSLIANAGQENQFNIEIPTLSGSIKVDGHFDEPQWKNAATTEITIETSPGEKTSLRQ